MNFETEKRISEVMTTAINNTSDRLSEHQIYWQRVGWDDCTRSKNSSLGRNISDWTFQLKNGSCLPFLRHQNFNDKTMTISAKDIAITIGNEKYGGNLKSITFENYLKNYGKYTPGVPDDINLSQGDNELVTIRIISVIVPEDETGSQEIVPTCYNYQTMDSKNPKNIIGATFHLGTGSRTDGTGAEKVYLVKTMSNNNHENTWFRITNEQHESQEQKEAIGSVLGTRSAGVGRNRVMCFQIPREQDRPQEVYRGFKQDDQPLTRSIFAPKTRGISVGNVSYGSSAGKYSRTDNMTYKRDKSQNVTLTLAYYYTTSNGNITNEDIDSIVKVINNTYEDSKSEWVGSLVTGEVDPTFSSESVIPPINLPEPSQEDYNSFNQKVTNFPEKYSDITDFPE